MATEEKAPKKGGGKKGLLLGVLAVLLSVAAAVFGTLYLGDRLNPGTAARASAPAAPMVVQAPVAAEAKYLDLSPAFVVNYSHQDELRYVQLSVSAMARSEETLEAVEAHLPRIRNSLIMLFGSQDFETLGTQQGKEQLQELALNSIREIIREEARVPDVEAVYFTNFVMQ